ncbi:WD repeat-containing protein 19 isoform X2 [Ceratina calcarata]|uniref:WD repeat-containing protein 19 isoform X2 n=2 Tax=Ceratina calcarata TaxID=156304 RepID=A0AAJ7IWV7_9HYME|nr:WD repeat-containing protein 19 isoform X2 [Ceratina calcarata]
MSSEKVLYQLYQPHGTGTVYISWRPGNSTHLATTGYDSSVAIFDRQGDLQERIQISGLCTGFGWDSDGDLMAVISENSSAIILWDATTGKKSQIDAGVRDGLTCLIWAKRTCLLAVGTQKGNLILYDHINARRVPILGKHKKKITCGAWSYEGLLALTSEDKVLTISTSDGDTKREIPLQGDASDIQFNEMKMDHRVGGENTVSLIISKTTLFLYNILDPENPIELAFQKRYGFIVTYKWYGDGYILVGFETGYFTAISTHIKEVGQELFQVKNHRDSLTDLAINQVIGKIVTCGDNTIKIHNLQNLEETEKLITISEGDGGISTVEWSMDGTMLAAVTCSGNVLVYLIQIPKLTSIYGNRIALLTSLTEVTVHLCTLDKEKPQPIIINTIIEPSVIAVGPLHVAVGLNNRALFWDISDDRYDITEHFERDYLATIDSIRLNEAYVSVLFDGKLQLHSIKVDQDKLTKYGKDTKMFPGLSTTDRFKITCHALGSDFLIYGTDMGHVIYFNLDVFNQSTEYLHENGIQEIYADANGTQLCFVDNKFDVYLYNPVYEVILQVSDCPDSVQGVIWDQNIFERNIFAVYNKNVITTYIFVKYSIEGENILKITTMKLPSESLPLLMYSGELTLSSASNRLTQITLSSHEDVGNIVDATKTKQVLENQILCRRFRQAWTTCERINEKESWLKLGESSIASLNVDFAIRVYRHLEDASMVWALEKMENIDELPLLCGHACILLGDYNRAEKFFLQSSEPVQALYLRRDLMQWEHALNLAHKLKADEIPFIAREYAQQLEFTGNYPKALTNYERGLVDIIKSASNMPPPHVHRNLCLAGIARMSIRCGDSRKGVNIAMDSDSSRQLRRECAEILESMKQFNEAAILYEKAEYFDKAASAYIKLKNWQKVGQLLPQISSAKINIQYAKAKEAEGKYEDAAKAYETAKDYENIIRINLEHLNNPARSVEVVQQTKSVEGAKMVAKYFQRMNDYNSAIKFLILSNCHEEGFQLANQHGKMELYGEILINTIEGEENARREDFKSLAVHFESQKNNFLAGKYYFHAKEYQKALRHLLKAAQLVSDENKVLSLAIDTVASSKDDKLANQLIDFLLGGDGLPKEPKYLFRLYMARKQYKEAGKTAIIIANEEQVNGNYRNAHDVLFGMYQELKRNKINIPLEMQNNLRLLHSYILVRLHVKKNDHLRGARMLIRVANNISKFPSRRYRSNFDVHRDRMSKSWIEIRSVQFCRYINASRI